VQTSASVHEPFCVVTKLAVFSGKRNVTVWRLSVPVSLSPVGILIVTHRDPTVRRTDILVIELSVKLCLVEFVSHGFFRKSSI